MKRILATLVLLLFLTVQAVTAQSILSQPGRLLAKQFNTNADVFTQTNPDLAGTPLTLTSATGVTPADGGVVFSLGAGFTPPTTFTIFFWQMDNVATAKAGWRRPAPAATGANVYAVVVDSTYSMFSFSGPPNTPFLVMASESVTGDVYTNAKAHPSNNNTATGY